MAASLSYGEHLPDQVDRLVNLSQAQLELLGDVRELYRERSILEREYASKLQVLAQKAATKKAKSMARLVVGDDPTKAFSDSVLASSTVEVAYAQVVGFVADAATYHIKLADTMNTQVVDSLKLLAQKHDDAQKKQHAFFQKLLSERDRVYSERTKSKQKYDEECIEVENYRHKQGKATDDRHADRAAKQFEQQQMDMNNAKNAYLLSIAVANECKTKFYNTDLPALENQLQRIQTSLLESFAALLLQATSLETNHLSALQTRVQSVTNSASAISPAKDQDLFVDYNIRPFSAPPNFVFEPCGVHYDAPDMNIEPAAKVVLQNRLAKSKSKLREIQALLDSKRGEVEKLSIQLEAGGSDPESLSNNMIETYLDASHEVTSFASSQAILQAEVDTIMAALDGDEGGQSPHQFKSSSFSIPTTCGFCKTSIWGLSKQGKTCKACALSVHAKCELKVPADCGGARGKHGNTGSISISRSSISSRPSTITSDNTPTPSSFVETQSVSSFNDYPTGRMLYTYAATSPFELSVSEGTSVTVMEDDDGSGWIKVDDGSGGKGLVPASYVDLLDEAPVPLSAKAKSSNGSGQFVRGLYDYTAQGPDEMNIKVAQNIELSSGPSGGQNYATGWWEGIAPSGQKKIFPSNYVELV